MEKSIPARAQWYFVTIIVLTYCEKKLFQCEEKSEKKVCKFEAVRPRICNVFEIFVPHTIEQFFFTVSQKYYGNRLLFRLFLFFPKKKKNNQKFLGYGNNRKYTENIQSHDYSYIFEHTYQNGQKLDNDIPHF